MQLEWVGIGPWEAMIDIAGAGSLFSGPGRGGRRERGMAGQTQAFRIIGAAVALSHAGAGGWALTWSGTQ